MLFEFVLVSGRDSDLFEVIVSVEVLNLDVSFQSRNHVENVQIECFHVFVFG